MVLIVLIFFIQIFRIVHNIQHILPFDFPTFGCIAGVNISCFVCMFSIAEWWPSTAQEWQRPKFD